MKRIISLFAILTLLATSCTKSEKAIDSATETHISLLKPLPATYSINHLKNDTIAAAFSLADFNWNKHSLHAKVFAIDLYNAADIKNLEKGDTLIFDANTVIIDSILTEGNMITINGGIEQGGAQLIAYRNGTYRAFIWDDYPTYTLLGETDIPLASTIKLVDCGPECDSPYTTIIAADIKSYLSNAQQYKQSFTPLDTEVIIINGKITTITRRWTP